MEWLRTLFLMIIAFLLSCFCYAYLMEKRTIYNQSIVIQSQVDYNQMINERLNHLNDENLILLGRLTEMSDLENKNVRDRIKTTKDNLLFVEKLTKQKFGIGGDK